MKADILKLLLQSYASGDDASFRKAALQLAAVESAAGHSRVAEDLRAIVAKMPLPSQKKAGTIVDIAQPRGELSDILEGGHRKERLRDIILRNDTRELLLRVIEENRSRAKLEQWGVSPRRKLLFYGPPGCGKTLTASVIAGEMGLPLMTVRLDSLFSRFLGATANHLRAVFAEMPRRPGVYLFDEFDSVAKSRGDAQDVGEINRVVTAFLQLMDMDVSAGLIVAATNHIDMVDHAVFRRFDLIIGFEEPSEEELASLLVLRLGGLGVNLQAAKELAKKALGRSFADVSRACDDAIRTMALAGKDSLSTTEVSAAIDELKKRDIVSRRVK